MDFAVEKISELGMGRIIPLLSERSVVKSSDDSGRLERWRRIARSAMVQSGQAQAMEIAPPMTLTRLLEDSIQALPHPSLLFAHFAPDSVSVQGAIARLPQGSPVILFIGPEGGFADEEAEEARRAGAAQVSLGATRLRTETAAIVAAALTVDALRRSH
jgi:16S rRNA (uracil1498-N3)-methyltransferase